MSLKAPVLAPSPDQRPPQRCQQQPVQAKDHLRADLAILLVTLLAAAGWIFSKEALGGLPPLLFVGIRFLLAGGVVALVGWRALRRLSFAQFKATLGVGAVMAVAIMFWVQGLFRAEHTGEGAFITSLGVILVPLVARLLFGERSSRSTWFALPCAIAGLACLSLDQGFRLEAGQLLFLISAIVFAVHFTLNSRVVAQVPAIALTAVQLAVVGSCALLLSIAVETWPDVVPVPTWGWLLASALIATSLRFFLQTYGQGLAPASHVAIIMVLEPVWTAILAVLWLGEGMTGLQLLGCGLIFAALLINRWRWVRGLLRLPWLRN